MLGKAIMTWDSSEIIALKGSASSESGNRLPRTFYCKSSLIGEKDIHLQGKLQSK